MLKFGACFISLIFALAGIVSFAYAKVCQPPFARIEVYAYSASGKGEYKKSGDFYMRLKKEIADNLKKILQAKNFAEIAPVLGDRISVSDDKDPFSWQDREISASAFGSLLKFPFDKDLLDQFCSGFTIYFGQGAYYYEMHKLRDGVQADTKLDDRFFAKYKTKEMAVVNFWRLGGAGRDECFFLFERKNNSWQLTGYLCHLIADWWGEGE